MGAISETIIYNNGDQQITKRIPEWTKDYTYVTLHRVKTLSQDKTYVYGFNTIERTYGEPNILYGYLYYYYAVDGYYSKLENGKWTTPEPTERALIRTTSPYAGANDSAADWANQAIYGWGTDKKPNDQKKYALSINSSPPKELVLEYGFTDYGSDDAIQDMSGRVLEGYKDWSIAGAFRVKVRSFGGPNAASVKFDWYLSGKLVKTTQDSRTVSDYKPPTDTAGTFSVQCTVTVLDADGNPLQESVYSTPFWEKYDFARTVSFPYKVTVGPNMELPDGISPGGPGSIPTVIPVPRPKVTDILLTIDPETVAPGGRSVATVSVIGSGNYNRAYTAELSGNVSSQTFLVHGGSRCNVWIGEDETAESVTVTVASEADPTITASGTIYIGEGTGDDDGITPEKLQLAFWKGYAAAKAMYGGVE